MNAYQYGKNNPVTNADPTGLMIINDGGGAYVPPAIHVLKQVQTGWNRGIKNWIPDKWRGVKQFVKDPKGTVKATAVEVESWNAKYHYPSKVMPASVNLGAACVITGVCQVYEDFKAGNYVDAGYGASQMTADLVAAGVTEGAGAVVGAGLRVTSIATKAANTVTKLATKPSAPKPTTPKATKAPKPDSPSGSAVGCHSFAPSTPVLMADGEHKPISEVTQGDEVKAHDPETGETTNQKVTELHINLDTELTDLTVQTEEGDLTTLYTTQNHPFWSETRNDWVNAEELQPAERLGTDSGSVAVASTRNYVGSQTMRDLTVANIHTYYVIADSVPVLVHNCGGEITVYRGVPEGHPGYANAQNGLAVPRGGDSTAEMHQLGHTDSVWTSWSTNSGAAERAATRGETRRGVVIEARIPKNQPHIHVNDQPWADPELRFEFEVLVEGPLEGVPREVGR
ncbi:hypothetical protein GSF22_32765 [Micromonospora echinofusca]|uniref:Hint domain-containing protein n=2 Tax=Micromonospora echinofusca TaxID=47858 RepID=A0ABS3W1X3_MICEH|nr:hypothetical protein [Micromonospora echinofusca]